MTGNGRFEASATLEPTKAEVSLATDIALAMVKTAKGLRMYLPNSPLLKKFSDELLAKIQKHHEYYGDFWLDVDEFSFRYKRNKVYESEDDRDSIPFRMHADGIRVVIFSEGVDSEELCSFLDTVSSSLAVDVDDDIVTRLWQLTLPHVSLILAEDFMEIEGVVERKYVFGSQQKQIRLLYDSLPPSVPVQLPTIHPQFHFLTAAEAKMLRTYRETDALLDPVQEITEILSTILNGVTEPHLFGSFVDITVKMTAKLIDSGEIKTATHLIEVLHRLAVSDTVSAGQAARAVSGFLTETTINSLRRVIDTTEAFTPGELRALLLMFGKPSVLGICELLGQVEKMKMRKLILDMLIEFGKDEPQVFTPLLTDSRWYLVRNVVLILAKLKDPGMLDTVTSLISHPDERVRKEVLSYLNQIQSPKSKTHMIRFLRDESQKIRIRTLQILGECRFVSALKPVSALVDREGFENASLAEKTAVFETIGQLGQERVLPLFRTMLLKRHWFNRTKGHQSVICAIAGIRKVGGEIAVRTLEEGLKGKNPAAHDLILKAIAAITAELDVAQGRTSI